MKKSTLIYRLVLAAAFAFPHSVDAEVINPEPLHVLKSSVNADSDNAEFCLEFDQPLSPLTSTRLSGALHLESEGKKFIPQNIEVTRNSLCMFPLDRQKSYRVEISGLKGEGEGGGKMAAPYSQSFSIPDRPSSIAFTGKSGGLNGFASYDAPFLLRSVNVPRAKATIYKVNDTASLARAWQDRMQATLAPSESVYLARNKGQQVWTSDNFIGQAASDPANVTKEQTISLRDLAPDLAPGLYLLIVDAGKGDPGDLASKGLSPLAAIWFTKSNFSIRALRDTAGIHVFSSLLSPDVHFVGMNKRQEQVIEAQNAPDGVTLMPYPAKLSDPSDISSVIGTDSSGNIAFADNEPLPFASKPDAYGSVSTIGLFSLPGSAVDLNLATSNPESKAAEASTLRAFHGDSLYSEFVVPPLEDGKAKVTLLAPERQGEWKMKWQKNDGTPLGESFLRVSSNADAPHLDVRSEKDYLTSDAALPIVITASTSSEKPEQLVGGQIKVSWQMLDPTEVGWKGFHFGVPTGILNAPVRLATFLTDLQGSAQIRLTLPKPPAEPGLYQASLLVSAHPDVGASDAKPLLLPLRPDSTVIGIKPLAQDARFAQNGIARFALIGLASDGKAKDVANLSYQIYEAGRSFAWFQDEGHWQYKPEPQLRPIGGGSVSLKGDGTTTLEWPVTAGNYQLEILDQAGKKLAQTDFSAGWDSLATAAVPLSMTVAKTLQVNRDATVHIVLPERAMVTLVVADQRVRKVVHELRDKGDNSFTITPTSDWQGDIHVIADAVPQNGVATPLRALAETTLSHVEAATTSAVEGTSLSATYPVAALSVHKGERVTMTFAFQNYGEKSESYHYTFVSAPGLKIERNDKGTFSLLPRQSKGIPVSFFAEQVGAKDFHIELVPSHGQHITHSWALNILQKDDVVQTRESVVVAGHDPLFKVRPAEASTVLVSKRPTVGLTEVLSALFNSQPFTTQELAAAVEGLRLWSDVAANSGITSDLAVKARRQEWMNDLLRRQNFDGGFPGLRGGESDMENTAAALITLGLDGGSQTTPARKLAAGWLKQRLSNTWFDDKERNNRASAYAGLAAANDIDPASLHYFSDTSALQALPAVAEADIAAAFKYIKDPNAAAFWIKKMLDEHSEPKSIALLNALAATDALSSDDVQKALTSISAALKKSETVDIEDLAGLLKAMAADSADAGTWRMATGNETQIMSGVIVLHGSDASARNADASPLFMSYLGEDASPLQKPLKEASVTRRVFKLSGAEVSAQAHPSPDEIYVVELHGMIPPQDERTQILVQDGQDAMMRPIGCALSAKLAPLAFLPWLSLRDITPTSTCEMTPYAIGAVLSNLDESDNDTFRLVYFSHIDAATIADIPLPTVRLIK